MSRDFDPWPLADRVRRAQEELGLSVRGAARAAGVPKTTYFETIRGNREPGVSTAVKLLRFAGVLPTDAATLQGTTRRS